MNSLARRRSAVLLAVVILGGGLAWSSSPASADIAACVETLALPCPTPGATLRRERHREHHHIGHWQQLRQVGGVVDTDARRAAHHHDLGLERLQPAADGLPDSVRPIRSGTLSHP